MANLKTAWSNLQDGLGNRFAWSHVKSIYYNWATKKLLKTKLDEMDALIDAKIAKAMMTSQNVNDANKIPNASLTYAMNQKITQNTGSINQLNSDMMGKTILKNAIVNHGSTAYAFNNDLYNGYHRVGMVIVYVGVEATGTECDILLINTLKDYIDGAGDLKLISSSSAATGTETPNIRFYLHNGVLCTENKSGKQCTINVVYYPAV